jgi:hypothetical protein
MKNFFLLISFIALTNCVNSIAMLGPLISVGTSGGSIYQAGISYGTTTAVEKITGKTTSEHIISSFTKNNKKESKNKIDIYVNRY